MAKLSLAKLAKKTKKLNILTRLDNSFLVRLMMPKKNSESYINTKKNLKRIGFNYGVERIESYRILIIFISLIVLMGSYFGYIKYENHNLIYGQTYAMKLPGVSLTSASDPLGQIERQVLILTAESVDYKSLIKSGNYQDLAEKIKEIEHENGILDQSNIIALNTIKTLTQVTYNRSSLLVCLILVLVSILASAIVNIIFKIKYLIHENYLDTELKNMEILTVVLLKNSKMNVEQLLTNLRDSSNILRPYFNECLALYPENQIAAIDRLIKDVDDPDFTKYMSLIQQNLISDRETNIKLLEAQKNLDHEIAEEKYRKKNNHKALLYTLISFPNFGIAVALLFIPILIYINTFL